MKVTNIVKTTLVLASLLSLNTSCKKWLDVNQTPNELEQGKGTLELALPSAEYTISYVVGNKYAEIGGFLSQYYTQNPSSTQYYDFDRYSFDANDADREWSQLYAGALKDLNFIVEKGTASGDSNYVAAAKILQAYSFQLVSDVHGDVPFSEALLAQSGNIAPHYDAQSAVYDGCLVLLNDAINMISLSSTSHPGTDDVIFHGDMGMWLKFANTLKLKLAMRQSNVRPTTTAAILASLATADFLEAGENASIAFSTTKGNQNPLYASIQGLGVDNNVASKTIGDYLNQSDTTKYVWYDTLIVGTDTTINEHRYDFLDSDPRAGLYFDAETFGAVGVNGIAQGAAAESPGAFPANTPNSSMSPNVFGPSVPVILMSDYESLLLQAEAQVKGWLAGGAANAQANYETAIANSLLQAGVPDTGSTTNVNPDLISNPIVRFLMRDYIVWPSTTADQLERIAIQKWVLMCGTQSMEAWIESRRTGYPAFTESLASQLPVGLLPQRIPYVSGEETTNPNFPGQLPITTKMWWAQ